MENNEFVTTQTSAVKWSAPDSTGNYINKNNYVKVNPELVKYLKRKIKEEQGIKRTDLLYHYLYFCDAIIDLKIRNKKFKDIEYTHINYKTIIKVISKYKYKKIVNNLLDWGVVECDNIIKIGSKSKGYKLKPPFDTNFKEILIKDKKINEKINRYKSTTNTTIENLSISYQYLRSTNKRIKINEKEAQNYNQENYYNENKPEKYDFNYFSIRNFSVKYYWFHKDQTGYRAHSNLTNLNKEFRKFLSVDGESLGEIDIKNSQPLFFYLLIKDNPDIPDDEKIRFKKIVEGGRFYELFMEKLNIHISKRGKIKKKIIAAIFFDYNRKIESRYIKVLKEEFPAIAHYIYQVKKEDHAKLACILQRMESNLVIEKAVTEFKNRFGDDYEFVSTIHDSIVVKESKLDDALQVMKDCFQKEGLNPQLTPNKFNPTTNQNQILP